MQVAVAGQVVPGPAGAAGTITMPIRVAVMRRRRRRSIRKLHQYQVQVTDPSAATQFVFNDPNVACPSRRRSDYPGLRRLSTKARRRQAKKAPKKRRELSAECVAAPSQASPTIPTSAAMHAVEIRPAADHRLGAGFGQRVGMAGIAVRGAGEADDAHAGRLGAGDAVHGILDDEGVRRIGAERFGRVAGTRPARASASCSAFPAPRRCGRRRTAADCTFSSMNSMPLGARVGADAARRR